MLLARFGFGMYLGDPAERGGEVVVYYDHRHDDFAAGLKLTGLGSGIPGHFGAEARYYFGHRIRAFARCPSGLRVHLRDEPVVPCGKVA